MCFIWVGFNFIASLASISLAQHEGTLVLISNYELEQLLFELIVYLY